MGTDRWSCTSHTGILVPLYILVLGFSPKRGIPLSNVTILGGAIANTIHASRSRHPAADRPLLDWVGFGWEWWVGHGNGHGVEETFFFFILGGPPAGSPWNHIQRAQNLILMMEPTTIVGAVIGSFLNKVRSFFFGSGSD